MLLLCAPGVVLSGVYQWVDDQGQVHFSDQPVSGAKEIQLRESTVYTPPSLPDSTAGSPSNDGDNEQGVAGAYDSIAIVSPSPDEPIRSNEGQVNISVELIPGLRAGHKIRVYLDGTQASDDLDSTQISLQEVDRGTHTLGVGVVDANGEELKRSETISFHLLRIAAPKVQPFGGG